MSNYYNDYEKPQREARETLRVQEAITYPQITEMLLVWSDVIAGFNRIEESRAIEMLIELGERPSKEDWGDLDEANRREGLRNGEN